MSSLIWITKPSFLFLETVAMSNSKCSQILTSMSMLNFFNLFCWLSPHRLKCSYQIGCFSATSAMIPSRSSCKSVSYCSAWVSLSRSCTLSSIRSAGLCTLFLCTAASLEKNEQICCGIRLRQINSYQAHLLHISCRWKLAEDRLYVL